MDQEHSTRLETAEHQKLLDCGHHKTGLSSRSSLPGHPSGLYRKNSPLTVAGAVAVLPNM